MRTFKHFLTISAILFSAAVFAQSSVRTSAIMAYKDWMSAQDKTTSDAKASLIEAKEFIDKCYGTSDDKWNGKQDAKTLYYRGKIYMAFQMYATDAAMMEKYPLMDLMKAGLESYQAHIDLPNKKSKDDFSREIQQEMGMMRNQAATAAANAYNAQNYEMAFQMYASAAELLKISGMTDTASYFNAALCALFIENWDFAAQYFEICANAGYRETISYAKWGESLFKQDKVEEGTKVLETARAKFPKDPDLYIIEANHYLLKSGDITTEIEGIEGDSTMSDEDKAAKVAPLKEQMKTAQDKAAAALTKAIDADPTNVSVYYAVGAIQNETGDTEGAQKSYEKALEIDPNYFDALYGLGALFFNKGVEINKELNDVADMKIDNEKVAAMNTEFKKAVPYLEQARAINPKDKPTLHALWKAYLMLKENEKAAEIYDLLKN